MNSDKNGKQKLPDGWILCKSKTNSGRKYFFNKKTGKSSWTQPQADDKPGQSKPKGKKEKSYCHEKGKVIKKPEPQNKNLKRKSDSQDDGYSKKKQKQDTPTPEKQKLETQKKSSAKNLVLKPIKKDSPLKPSSSSLRCSQSSVKPTPTKNIANSRLSQLRAQLNAKVKPGREDETNKSPSKNHKISPKIPLKQTETLSKVAKLELKSPNFNESKCSTTQSPSSDSFQSIPSPSQFFAANKIISSMKAQLPDEYCNKAKPKDTFADIEQGICNQTAEYPFMKHPATPPQFSEANKLVSAIKSKLSYKGAAKDTLSVGKNKAKERMEVLRTRLSNEAVNNEDFERNFLDRIELPKSADEAMEVEESKEVTQSVPSFQCTKNNIGKENVVLVVDTNIFIHELDVIKNVLNSHIKGYTEQPTLLVPWRVVNELDRLKDNNNGNGAICKRARSAMDYLYKSLPENNRIKGQSLRDSNSHIYPCELPDDEILNCCLQQAERGKSVILLSNDKNLCNKAMMNCVKCIGLDELKSLLENKPQPAADPDLHASVKHYENTMYHLLANILENEMRAKYNNLWQHVLFKAPPWTLSDVLQCLLKHWIAVFNEVFPRIEHLMADLRNTLVSIESKDPKSLSRSEVTNFKELCSEIAKKCQIIPEYMELAKSTVERLARKCKADPDRKEMPVIDAFEGLWTVFSSYCSKLASGLGVAHNVEDKLPSHDPLHVLTSKWPMFSAQIYTLTHCMKESLNMDNLNSDMESHVARLEAVFRESLALVGMNSAAVNKNNMRIFCTSCRNMLHEAVAKFSELTELLDVCKTHIAYD